MSCALFEDERFKQEKTWQYKGRCRTRRTCGATPGEELSEISFV